MKLKTRLRQLGQPHQRHFLRPHPLTRRISKKAEFLPPKRTAPLADDDDDAENG